MSQLLGGTFGSGQLGGLFGLSANSPGSPLDSLFGGASPFNEMRHQFTLSLSVCGPANASTCPASEELQRAAGVVEYIVPADPRQGNQLAQKRCLAAGNSQDQTVQPLDEEDPSQGSTRQRFRLLRDPDCVRSRSLGLNLMFGKGSMCKSEGRRSHLVVMLHCDLEAAEMSPSVQCVTPPPTAPSILSPLALHDACILLSRMP